MAKVVITEKAFTEHTFNESQLPPEALAALKNGDDLPAYLWFCGLDPGVARVALTDEDTTEVSIDYKEIKHV